MLGDRERTQLQETGELTIEPRVSVYEIVDLLSDLGLTLGDDAHMVECMTNYGLGFRLTTQPVLPQPDSTTGLSEGTGDKKRCPKCGSVDPNSWLKFEPHGRVTHVRLSIHSGAPFCPDPFHPQPRQKPATTQKPQDKGE